MATSPGSLPSSPSLTGSSASTTSTNTYIVASTPSSASTTGGSTSTCCYSHEPFSAFRHKFCDLCIEIGVGTPTAVTQMRGGSYNRIIGLILPNLPPAIIRIPRFAGDVLQGIHDQHAVSSFLGKTVIPVPETIAFGATIESQIGSEYMIQRRIPGVSLDGIYEGLDMNGKQHVLGQVIDLLAEMESIRFPATGQLVAAGYFPDALIVNGSDTPYNAGVATAPFPAGLGERRQPGPTPATLEDALADRLRVWDAERDTPQEEGLAPMWERLSEIIVEMRGLGFFEECSVAPNVLHHWDFEPRNIMVEGENGLYKVTGLLDWDKVQSVPLVLARKPPAWLWLPEEVTINGAWWDGDVDELELGPAELRTLFEQEMDKRVGSKYVEDAFGKGRWIRRVWRFLLYGFKNSEDLKRFDRLVGEWSSYSGSGKSAA